MIRKIANGGRKFIYGGVIFCVVGVISSSQADAGQFRYSEEYKMCLNQEGEYGLNPSGTLPYLNSGECTDFSLQGIFGQNLGPFNFKGANFQCATVSNSTFTSVTFKGADLRSAKFINILFHGANMKDATYNSRTRINNWSEQTMKKLGMVRDDSSPDCENFY